MITDDSRDIYHARLSTILKESGAMLLNTAIQAGFHIDQRNNKARVSTSQITKSSVPERWGSPSLVHSHKKYTNYFLGRWTASRWKRSKFLIWVFPDLHSMALCYSSTPEDKSLSPSSRKCFSYGSGEKMKTFIVLAWSCFAWLLAWNWNDEDKFFFVIFVVKSISLSYRPVYLIKQG